MIKPPTKFVKTWIPAFAGMTVSELVQRLLNAPTLVSPAIFSAYSVLFDGKPLATERIEKV